MRLALAMLAAIPAPALAQHAGHQHGQTQSDAPTEDADPHAGHNMQQHGDHAGHAMPNEGGAGSMDHSQMDHSKLEHAQPSASTSGNVLQGLRLDIPPPPEAAPPASAGGGPPRAADAIWGADVMRASRAALKNDHGGQEFFWFQGDRVEYRPRDGADGYLWDVQGYYGGDIDKFWFKSEGEGAFGESVEDAEVQGLWSHAIGPWWDFQTGIRQDLTGPERTHFVFGAQGLAPYLFEVDAAAFVSNEGDITARIEGELDQRLTQRLILQPRVEIALAAQDIPELGIDAGLDHVEAGVRLRYEITPEFAPYVGLEQEWKVGGTADLARADGEGTATTSLVAGVRFWF